MRCISLLATLTGLLGVVLPCFSQSSGQDVSLGGLSIRRDSVMAPTNPDYNVMLGDLALGLEYFGGMTYDDNANRASGYRGQEPSDTVTFTNGLGIELDYPLTPNVRLSGGISLQGDWILSGEGNSGIYVTGTNFGGDNEAGLYLDLIATDQHLITISDRLARYRDMSDQAYNLDSNAGDQEKDDLSYWTNESAIQWEYHISPLIEYALRLQRTTVWTDEQRFEYLERTEDEISTKVKFQVNPNLSIEPYFSYNEVKFQDHNWEDADGSHKPGNNDYEEKELGIAGLYHINPVMDLRYAFGWQWIDVDSSSARPGTSDEGNNPFYRLNLSWILTPTFRHYVASSYESEGSIIPHVNYVDIFNLGYGFDWQFHEDWVLGASLDWYHTNESDIGETGNLYEERITVTYIISQKAKITGWYMRRDHDSDLPQREYKQNVVGVQWSYKF